MRRLPVELCIFQDARGRQPFVDWFDRLGDRGVQARVMQRLDRLQAGNPGDCRTLGAGLMEPRIDTGSKRTQAADIERPRKWLEEARRQQSR